MMKAKLGLFTSASLYAVIMTTGSLITNYYTTITITTTTTNNSNNQIVFERAQIRRLSSMVALKVNSRGQIYFKWKQYKTFL